ncbi:MAG: hypothetical protein GFH27_549285n244 [Chloroflexi bacterium AL-W]|nr:hypothetical protein [Chloroflexi bacterium AL-N1]NOK65756.1 hypothetical protein [Chloroflexi bacterium AL-N10]NOK74303.1 hypothetical protein [Chloroflexi bacterium AL-N5]NOK80789.1 hypothetical protein [Chloroflexi bacterium AL-W]NOK88561.1 hypothetical protein [Chloroflexi bacterium AL-N15]
MEKHYQEELLNTLVAFATRQRLLTPMQVLLDIVMPVGFLASQVVLFVRPFTPYGRWRDYATVLSDEEGWIVLQNLVKRQEC